MNEILSFFTSDLGILVILTVINFFILTWYEKESQKLVPPAPTGKAESSTDFFSFSTEKNIFGFSSDIDLHKVLEEEQRIEENELKESIWKIGSLDLSDDMTYKRK
ncbi:hypothetical protein [Thermodesulfovibrio sp. TK110]